MRPLCACGCGRPVGIAKRTDRTKGIEKGQPLRYLPNHGLNKGRGPQPAARAEQKRSLGLKTILGGRRVTHGLSRLFDDFFDNRKDR